MADDTRKYITLDNLRYFLEKIKQSLLSNGGESSETDEQEKENTSDGVFPSA